MDIDFTLLRSLLSYNEQAPLVFNSGLFLFLFFTFLLIYLDLRKQNTLRIIYVSLFSIYFYYKTSGVFDINITTTYFNIHLNHIPQCIFMLIVMVWDFSIARFIFKTSSSIKRKLLLTSSILVNLGMMCYFKYTNFLYEIYCSLVSQDFVSFDIILPIGISFFTFQSMSYTIDVYRNDLKPLDSLIDYAFYVSFFPQLVAGPIVRARDFIPQIRQKLWVSADMFGKGIFLICTGLFKKAVISDYISVNFVDRIFESPTLYSGVENLFGIYGYALQIYCDFSGYSDMAIGLALILGFQFNINFDSPYKSASITEFWRRWHISLSSWLRDYLYISLGGSRKGKIRTYINLMLTMLLGGLWHGASLRFIIWGAIHGVTLAIHKLAMNWWPSMKIAGSQMSIWRRILGILLTFHLVCFSWIFFRATTYQTAIDMINQIFTHFQFQILWELLNGYKSVFILMSIGYILHFMPRKWEDWSIKQFINSHFIFKTLAVFFVIVLIMQIKSANVLSFIYFNF